MDNYTANIYLNILNESAYAKSLEYHVAKNGTHIWQDVSKKLQYRWVQSSKKVRAIVDGDDDDRTISQDITKKRVPDLDTAKQLVMKRYKKDLADGRKNYKVQIFTAQSDKTSDKPADELNEAAKCTRATKKASSNKKDKKWMQCVKNPDGPGYKRVHWGQPGVKVTGKSGNTARKKSFRARHKCSTAKPGTPRYQACKDW